MTAGFYFRINLFDTEIEERNLNLCQFGDGFWPLFRRMKFLKAFNLEHIFSPVNQTFNRLSLKTM